jgi:uncharacterized repeat protein (TIGR03987 family)
MIKSIKRIDLFIILPGLILVIPFCCFIMNTPIALAATLITLALLFYSIGVWSERISRYLKVWHIVAFWTGFVFDLSGTWAMSSMSDAPFNLRDLHTLTGQIAIWLMLIHAIWATVVVSRRSENLRMKFHRYSLVVWLIWLIPYFGGMIMGMSHKA